MLQVTYNESDRILLDMADCAEQAGRYNQGDFGRGCDTPACMLGTYAWRHTGSNAFKYVSSGRLYYRPILRKELQITEEEFIDLFGSCGCGGAGKDGNRAAEYVREFVRARALARIER